MKSEREIQNAIEDIRNSGEDLSSVTSLGGVALDVLLWVLDKEDQWDELSKQ